MRSTVQFLFYFIFIVGGVEQALAQQDDEERMNRDIEVAENVLTTLIKQQFSNQRMFFPLEIKGYYQEGYGVTFTLPADFTTPIVFTTIGQESNNSINVGNGGTYSSYSRFEISGEQARENKNAISLKDRSAEKRQLNMDSLRNLYNEKVIDAAKTFILDYGDMLTAVNSQEKITITNQGSQPRAWVNQYFNSSKRSLLSIDMLVGDLKQMKSGKLSREQGLSKINVLNTETIDPAEPDLELFASMVNRLYRPDLSKTYFTDNYVYYERLKDFGVIYYLQVISSSEIDYQRYVMPTVGLTNVDLETRNKKVTELYPVFEQGVKANMIDYGRTLKSIKDNELLIFEIRMTQCPDCGIPASLECSVKGKVLKDFAAGAISRNEALQKVMVKKGPKQ